MTNRDMTVQVQAEIAKAQNEPVHLFVAELSSGTFRFTDGYANITWNGDQYLASGKMISFEAIKETSDAKISQTVFNLSGIDQTLIAAFMEDEYVDRRIRLYKTFLNANGTVMEPTLLFDGRMDAPIIQENPEPDFGTCTIAISATSHFGDFERKPGRRTNTHIQEFFYPGDKFFDHNSQIAGQKQITWGRVSP